MPAAFEFPPISKALTEPNGLLAQGGNLETYTLISAYSKGIFPWYDEGQPLLWWSPDPRAVIFPAEFNASRSLRKTMRKKNWLLSCNTNFSGVIEACAEVRAHSEGTWITAAMLDAYQKLHEAGYAHSIEVWEQSDKNHDRENDTKLIGGIYGVGIGKVFSGESMFHRTTDASKVALAAACQHIHAIGWELLDCQIPNDHLISMGATEISRDDYATRLQNGILASGSVKPTSHNWETLRWANTTELEASIARTTD